MQRRRGPNDLLVLAVPARHIDAHGDGLVSLVGDDHALARLLGPGLVLARRGGGALVRAGLPLGALGRATGTASGSLLGTLRHPLLVTLLRSRRGARAGLRCLPSLDRDLAL